jgi:hypothetical protein
MTKCGLLTQRPRNPLGGPPQLLRLSRPRARLIRPAFDASRPGSTAYHPPVGLHLMAVVPITLAACVTAPDRGGDYTDFVTAVQPRSPSVSCI